MREILTEFLTLDRKNGYTYYLKSGVEGFQIRRPEKEYEGYQLLKGFFEMPQVRLAQTETGAVLCIEGIEAPSCDFLVEDKPQEVADVLERFVEDTRIMWEETKKPMDETRVVRDWRAETSITIENILQNQIIQDLKNKSLVVNGQEYPSLGETLNAIRQRLEKPEKTMVLTQGDEQIAKLIAENGHCFVIDPGNYTGFNSPSSTVNNMVAGNYIFSYKYDSSIQNGDDLRIDYSLKPQYRKIEELTKPIFI